MSDLIRRAEAIDRIRKLWMKGEPLDEAWEHDDYAFGLKDAIDAIDDCFDADGERKESE